MTKRRQLLKYATAFIAGGVATLAGFGILPTNRRRKDIRYAGRHTVDVDISKLHAGELFSVTLDFRPVYIMRRSAESIAFLKEDNPALRDNDSEYSQQPIEARNRHRSVRPDIFVAYAMCTHLGCAPAFSLDHSKNGLAENWEGGYFACPCHGSVYDAAGRVSVGVPAPQNLIVPKHEFIDENTIRIYNTYTAQS